MEKEKREKRGRISMNVKKSRKGAIGVEALVYVALAVLVLLIGVGIYLVLKGEGDSLISYARNLLRFKG